MASVNKVILIGNLGRDPEVRTISEDNTAASFSIATTDTWKDKNGQKQERTEWHRIVVYGKQADIAGQYLKKGSSVFVEGRLQTRKWQDKEGNERQTVEVLCDRFQMLGGGNSPTGNNTDQGGGQQRQAAPAQAPKSSGGNGQATGGNGFDDFDGSDDIPFGHCSFEYDPIIKGMNRTSYIRSKS